MSIITESVNLDKVLYISKRYRQIEFTFGIKKEITWILKDDEERLNIILQN